MATSALGVVNHPCLTFYSPRANSFRGTSRPRQPYSSANRSPLLSRNRTCSTRIVRRRLHCNAEIESSESRGTHPDTILSCVSKDAEVSVFVVVATDLVLEAQRRHATAPTATAALGRLLMGTLLLGALKGWEESVQVSVLGRGELGQVTAVTSHRGAVKGYVGNPACDPPLNAAGKLDVGKAVGAGILTVVRSRPDWQQPYTGTIPLYSGEVAEDLTHYLSDSEQISSSVGLGVAMGKDGVVSSAGGFLVQVLPFCSEATITQLEANIQSLPPASQMVASLSPQDIIAALLKGLGSQPPEEGVRDGREGEVVVVGAGVRLVTGKGVQVPLTFGPCEVEDLKPRMLRAVESLGAQDVRSLLEEQGHVEVRCEFCAEVVRFKEGELDSILEPQEA